MLSLLTRDTARRLYEKATEAGALYEKATEAGALCLASVSEGAIKTLLRILTQLYYGHTNVGRRCISHLSPSRFCIASRLWYLSGTSPAPLWHLSVSQGFCLLNSVAIGAAYAKYNTAAIQP